MQTVSPLRLLAASAPGTLPPYYTATDRALRWLGFAVRAALTGAGWLLSLVLRAAALIVGGVVAVSAVVILATLAAGALIAVACPLVLWAIGNTLLTQSRLTAANAP